LFTAMTGIFTPAYPVSKRTGNDGAPGGIGVGCRVEQLTDEPRDVVAVEEVGGGRAFVAAVKSASHGEGNAEAHHLALLLDFEQLGIELVDQHLAGQADPSVFLCHVTVRLVGIARLIGAA
jgi:hypothetical protein